MAHEPMSIEGFDDIPDPAAFLSARPAPEPAAPTEPSPTRPAHARRVAAAAAAAAGWIALFVLAAGLRDDVGSPAVATPLALWALLAVLGASLSLRPRARGLPAGVRVVQAIVLGIPAFFLISVLASAGMHDGAPEGNLGGCLAAAGVATLAPLVLAAIVLQQTFLSAPGWRGAAIGAICGLCGAFGVHAHCPVGASAHVLLAHGAPILAGALLGAAAGIARGRA